MIKFVLKVILLKRTIFPLFVALCFMIPVAAQETVFEETTTIYSSEISGGIGMHTNGFSGLFRYGNYLSGFTKRIYEIEIANIKHPKEIKSIYPFEDNVRGYIYGKMNSLYVVRPSVGFHKVFIPKQSIKGVSVGYVFHLGASLGFAKPVYLNIIEREEITNNRIIVKRKYDPDEHEQGEIYGRASFLNGLDEMTFYPGVFGKIGLHFDFAKERESLRSLEVGFTIDSFFETIPIMAFAKNRAVYPNLYLTILFGKREVR
jgi:hypothetical protein